MKAKIEIKMDNAAFEDQPATELARILRVLAGHVDDGATEMPLLDINGNTVGTFKVTGRKKDYEGTEGQDRESYSDTQDRDNYYTP